MSLHSRRRTRLVALPGKVASQWRAIAWLAVVWVLLWGELTVGNVVAGVLIATLVSVLMPLPAIASHGRWRLGPFVVLAVRFIGDLVVASAQVSVLALRPGKVPHGGVVGVRLRNPSDVYLTITAELSSLVPGSIVVEAQRLTGMLYLHVLDLDQAGGPDGVRRDTWALEARVLRAFASDDDLHAAGLDVPRLLPARAGRVGSKGGGES